MTQHRDGSRGRSAARAARAGRRAGGRDASRQGRAGRAAPAKGSPHYRRARHDRGAETRQRLVEAALDVFGRYGFEGATTRQIAKEAKANLAAIVYHFGSKEALHVAVAEYIVGRIAALVGPSLAAAAAPDAAATPAAARAALFRLLEAYADVILGEAEAETLGAVHRPRADAADRGLRRDLPFDGRRSRRRRPAGRRRHRAEPRGRGGRGSASSP